MLGYISQYLKMAAKHKIKNRFEKQKIAYISQREVDYFVDVNYFFVTSIS